MASKAADPKSRSANRAYATGLARAFAGAIIFAFPLMMTMEMWWLGFYLDRVRLLLFLLVIFLILIPLSHLVGFERTTRWSDDLMDALAAFGVGVFASAVMLLLFGIITPDMPTGEVVGKIAIQTVPASFGAVLARGQMSGGDGAEQDRRERKAGYAGQLFVMLAGAIFLALNVAPTEEMILIAFKMTPWHALALIAVSIAVLHAFVYALGFRGQEPLPEGMGATGALISYSMVGYGIALLVSLYVLWTFGRTDSASLDQIAMMTTVLGFPAALGAATARLII